MSDCSYTAFSAPQPIRGQINWANGHRPTPLSYARFVDGEERRAVSIELDGVEYAPVRECEPRIELWDDGFSFDAYCGECGYPIGDGELKPWSYCPECGTKIAKEY